MRVSCQGSVLSLLYWAFFFQPRSISAQLKCDPGTYSGTSITGGEKTCIACPPSLSACDNETKDDKKECRKKCGKKSSTLAPPISNVPSTYPSSSQGPVSSSVVKASDVVIVLHGKNEDEKNVLVIVLPVLCAVLVLTIVLVPLFLLRKKKAANRNGVTRNRSGCDRVEMNCLDSSTMEKTLPSSARIGGIQVRNSTSSMVDIVGANSGDCHANGEPPVTSVVLCRTSLYTRVGGVQETGEDVYTSAMPLPGAQC